MIVYFLYSYSECLSQGPLATRSHGLQHKNRKRKQEGIFLGEFIFCCYILWLLLILGHDQQRAQELGQEQKNNTKDFVQSLNRFGKLGLETVSKP